MPPVTQGTNNSINVSNGISESTLPIKQIKISFKSVNIIFYLEIISVLIFFSILYYALSRPMLPEYGGFIYLIGLVYLFYLALPFLFFIVLNIIGFFIFSNKIKECRGANQKPSLLLKILNSLSKLIVMASILLVFYILIRLVFFL